MSEQQLLNSLYEFANGFFVLFALAQVWALMAWPSKAVTQRYPLSTKIILAWPFGTAWFDRVEQKDIIHFEKYQRRSRVGYYFGLLGVILSALSLFGLH